MRYWSTLPHRTLAETSAWLAKTLTGPQNGVTEFVICLRVSASVPRGPPEAAGPSEVIGKVGIWRTYGESFGGPCGEIGFLLHRAYWRQGLMREAMEVLLPYYFQPVEDGGRGLEAITADTDPRNSASIGFLRGFGFEVTGREEKTFQVGEEWVDSVYLGLRRELWVEREERGTERC
jgi:ribosomal-protein-alanine N-acetyltransferase